MIEYGFCSQVEKEDDSIIKQQEIFVHLVTWSKWLEMLIVNAIFCDCELRYHRNSMRDSRIVWNLVHVWCLFIMVDIAVMPVYDLEYILYMNFGWIIF